jgi:hypothetical protein
MRTSSLLLGCMLVVGPYAVAQERGAIPGAQKGATEKKPADTPGLDGKHVVVRLQGREQTYILREVSTRMIGRSAYLVGTQPDKSVDTETPLTMLRMDRIEEIVVFKDYEALQRRYRVFGERAKETAEASGGESKPQTEWEQLISEVARLDRLIGQWRHLSNDTGKRIMELEGRKDKLDRRKEDQKSDARAYEPYDWFGDQPETIEELQESITGHKAEEDAVMKQVEKLRAERKPLKKRADELRHKMILEGKLPSNPGR